MSAPEIRKTSCLCDEGKQHVDWYIPNHGWEFHSGQCCDCINIGVYSNGAMPDGYQDDDYDNIHICDLDAFIEALVEVRKSRDAT